MKEKYGGLVSSQWTARRNSFLKAAPMMMGLLLIGNPASAFAEIPSNSVQITQQAASVAGKVVDAKGVALIGVNIMEKGTTNGTITDIDGNFTLTTTTAKPVLVASYIGYATIEVPVAGKSSLYITLKEDTETLDEVVVVGYGVQKKVNLTGSVSSISSKEIQDIPVANTTTLLQGRMPGLVMTSNGAQAGKDSPEIRVRGIGTFGNNDPMVLIDGIEASVAQISDIPAADIESMSVLKDAASAAIYGVRAANGVILITTKRGKEGKVTVNYSGNYTLQTPGITPNYVDGYNFALMRNEADMTNARALTYDETALQKLKDGSDPDHYANTNWLDAVLRNASMHQHNLSVSGGTQNTKYMTSVNYADQDGIFKGTGVTRFGFRSNVDSRLKLFTFGVNVSGNMNKIEEPGVNPSGDGGIMRRISWFTRPTVPIQYSNGHYGYVDGSWKDPKQVKNPIEDMNLGYRDNDEYRFNGKAYAGIDIIKGLTFKTSFAYNFYMNATKSYNPKHPALYDAEGNELQIAGQTNKLTDYYYREATYTNENILTYNNKFGEHALNVMLGHSVMSTTIYSTTASIEGFPTENIHVLNGGSKNKDVGGFAHRDRLQSFFGRINYSYADKYLFEFNLRHDGSSRMPSENRYATFPSVSAGWVFSSEKFLEKADWLFGKLRLSWGTLGNQEIGRYAYMANLGASGKYYFDQKGDPQVGMVQTSIPNEDIKWETTSTVNAAIDLGFLNNKITTTFEWFNKRTDDILMQLPMPGIFTGSLQAPYQNVGSVLNRGWEWNVNYQDNHGDWYWNVGFNLSHVHNEILEMGDLTERIGGNTINRVGEAIGSYYGFKSLGLYRTQADLDRTNANGQKIKQHGQEPKLGQIMYEDVNNDGDITAEDRQIIGNPFPSYSYAFNLGASWKGFDLSMFWQGVAGIYRYSWETTSDIRGNFTDRWLDRYSPENINGKMPVLGNSIDGEYSSFWLEKSDYLRLKNLEFGYTFGNLPKIGVQKLRLYFTATNLLTFTPLKNWDPEKSSGDARNDVHPNMKTYSFGLNVTF